MKKLLTSVAALTLCALSANAQDTTTATQPTKNTAQYQRNWDNQKMQTGGELMADKTNLSTEEKIKLRDANAAKWQNASAEEKAKMMAEREKRGAMSPEEREKMKAGKSERKEQQQEKFNNASPEEKAKMEQRRGVMEKHSPEKREAVKAEMERHRAAMKQITGVDLVPAAPPAPTNSNR